MSKKKITFVIEQLIGGGAERVTAALVNEICKDDSYDVHLVVYKRDTKNDYKTDDRITWHVMEDKETSRLGAIQHRVSFLRNTIKTIKPDCVLSLGTPRITVLLTVAMIGLKCPLILSERNDPKRYPVTKVWRKLRDISYYLADGVVFQTTEAKECFAKSIMNKSVVICNPLTANLLERHENERDHRIVNCCRLSKQKNLDLLIDAFSDIVIEFPNNTLHIYGEGPEKEHLENKVVNLGLTDKVYFHDYSNRIHEEINTASLFVSSSDYEGISNSMLEAIALGIPTICTDCPVGGARETIEHGFNGMLVPVNDRNAMAKAMKEVLSNDELMDTLSKNGYLLREKINVTAITEKWLSFIHKNMN